MSKLKKRVKSLEVGISMNWSDMKKIETRLNREIRGMAQQLEALEEFATYADNMLTELSHALPDPEYDAKCEAQEADIDASLDRHRERLGLNKPQLKQLDQSVFNNTHERWKFAAVDQNAETNLFEEKPVISSCGNYWVNASGAFKRSVLHFDNSNWQNSLIERDIAKELLEVDLSSELTGSDYFYSKSVTERLENGQELVMCFVSNVSESDAMQERHVEVITSVDTEFNGTDGYGWQYAIPINNQGEPLTASEAGL